MNEPDHVNGTRRFKDVLCLKCRKVFTPKHPYNRLCPKCTKGNRKVAHLPHSDRTRRAGVSPGAKD